MTSGPLASRGLSAFFNVAQGTGAGIPRPGSRLPNEREFELTVDYHITRTGWFEGLWLRLRAALLEQADRTQTEIRVI
jgi:hypothetical protein